MWLFTRRGSWLPGVVVVSHSDFNRYRQHVKQVLARTLLLHHGLFTQSLHTVRKGRRESVTMLQRLSLDISNPEDSLGF